MEERVQQEAEELLSEPFATNYGFCYACAEKIARLNPSEQIDFLCFVLENITLVPRKKALRATERFLEKDLFDSLLAEQKKDLDILV